MKNVNWLGLIVCAVCVVASLAISIQYGLSISEVWWVALTYSGIGVAAVTWEITGPHRVAHLRREGRSVAMWACVFGLGLASIITIQYELGYLATLFEGKASVGESRAGNRASLEMERATLEGQISKAGAVRPAAAIQGDIDAVKANYRWTSSLGCTNVTAPESKELCASYGKLAAELGAATAIASAQARVRAINAELQPFAAAKVADARASYLSHLTGSSEMGARIILSIALIVFLWCGRTLAPFVYMDAKKAIAPETVSVATWSPETVAAIPAAEKSSFLPPAPLPSLLDDDFADEETGTELSAEDVLALWELDEEREKQALAALSEGRRDAKPQPEPAAEEKKKRTRFDPLAARNRQFVERFAADALLFIEGDRSRYEKAQLIWDAFLHWCAIMEIEDKPNRAQFGEIFPVILEDNGGEKVKWSEIHYVGVALKPAFAHGMAAAADAVTQSPEQPLALGERRLGSVLKDRRHLAVDSAEPMGNA